MDSGIIIDVETTGLNSESDKIIELGYLEFVFEGDSKPAIVETYGGLEDPGVSISDEITKITGISNSHVKDRKIDWSRLRSAMERAEIVIAHNADFDKGFVMRRPELAGLTVHWGCSLRHVDWTSKGFKSHALNYLAADNGFVNPFAHRAVFDCATTFRLVAPYLNELVERSYEREYKVLAKGAPFESKDVLKQNGYKWDPALRVWHKTMGEKKLELEREFLLKNVYHGSSTHEEVKL